jgi:hypothetical protein
MKVVVHKFSVGDVEDPQVYAGEPIWRWQQSEAGKWVLDHSLDKPVWRQYTDPYSYGYQFVIEADLKEEDVIYFTLKWGTFK